MDVLPEPIRLFAEQFPVLSEHFPLFLQLLGYGYPMPRAKESDAETARTEASLRALHASVIERAQANGK